MPPSASGAPGSDGNPKASLVESVQSWLVTTGYPLEMRVAQAFRAARPEATIIQQGAHYKDLETGKVRETDIDILWLSMSPETMQSISLQLIIECKSGTQPWVFFEDPDDSYIDVGHYGFAVAASAEPDDDRYMDMVHDRLVELGVPLFEGPSPLCYGVVQRKSGDSGQSQGHEKNPAYDSVRQAASGAAAVVTGLRPNLEPVSLFYAVPVVITTHPLLIAQLDEHDEVVVRHTGSACLHVRPGGYEDSLLVHVVHMEALSDFVAVCQETARSFEELPLDASPVQRARRVALRIGRSVVRRISGDHKRG